MSVNFIHYRCIILIPSSFFHFLSFSRRWIIFAPLFISYSELSCLGIWKHRIQMLGVEHLGNLIHYLKTQDSDGIKPSSTRGWTIVNSTLSTLWCSSFFKFLLGKKLLAPNFRLELKCLSSITCLTRDMEKGRLESSVLLLSRLDALEVSYMQFSTYY